MNSLASKTNRRDVRAALEQLPAELNSTYSEALKRIVGQVECDRMLAEQVFSWISYSCRPLSLRELQHALAVSPEMTTMDPEAIGDELTLTSVCAGLVVVDENSNAIHFVRR